MLIFIIIVNNTLKSSLPTVLSTETQTLASRAFESIKSDIIAGRLSQGSKIVESDLALKYGISRGPLREAIHRLEQIRLVVRVPHAGSRVVALDSKMIEDIYVARECLEGMAARLAARHMTGEDIRSLMELLNQLERDIGKADGKFYYHSEGNIHYHSHLSVPLQNSRILEYATGVRDTTT